VPGLSREDLRAAVPSTAGSVRVAGLAGEVEIFRDDLGIPHVRAGSARDAFFGQGFAHAQDRLWQMDYDRRRAAGRWAEWAGKAWVDQDVFMRRLGLPQTAEADYAAFDDETRAMFDAYAEGVNAFIASGAALPAEYALVGATPEPWRPWDGCAVYKVRHVLMGTLGTKLWRARLMQQFGPEMVLKLRAGAQSPAPVIASPGVDFTALPDPAEELTGAELVAGLWEMAGSNNWSLHGSRTASGKPLLAGDPHRMLDVPNVYYQNHVACPEWDVVGLSFAGVPGMPHFGHNADVAWGVTHAGADYHDLYVEKFAAGDPGCYEFKGEWLAAERRRETIAVRGGDPVEIDVTVTRHGPIVVGDPASGHALALRYTATDGPNRGFATFLPMLRATNVDELDATMRDWVDPGNNFMMADRHGTIGYLMRGRVPVRPRANGWLPVPGWTGEYEWDGDIPFEALPRGRNPETGWFATANNRIVEDSYPYYVALDWAPPSRAQRVVARVKDLTGATVADMASIHAERVSLPSRVFVAALDTIEPTDERAAEAKRLLQAWDGAMDADSVAATLYGVWREQTAATLIDSTALAKLRAIPAANDPLPLRALSLGSRLRAAVPALIARDDTSLLPPGETWAGLLGRALDRTIAWLTERLGPEMDAWTWGTLHSTAPKHTLAGTFPDLAELLNPPAVGFGGDGDTPQAAAYAGLEGTGFALIGTAVARYCFDTSDWDNSGWVVPLGASGHPGSPHYADQVEAWREVRLVPMRYDWGRIAREAETVQRLSPA
jgi:penicillin G amidase